MKIVYSIILGAFLLGTTTSCTIFRPMSIPDTVSAKKAFRLASERHILMIDVRETEEVAELAYQVPGIKNVPLSTLEEHLDEIPRGQPVIVACKSGRRSAKAIMLLQACGYTRLTNMKGGMLSWEAKGLPVIPGASVQKSE